MTPSQVGEILNQAEANFTSGGPIDIGLLDQVRTIYILNSILRKIIGNDPYE